MDILEQLNQTAQIDQMPKIDEVPKPANMPDPNYVSPMMLTSKQAKGQVRTQLEFLRQLTSI